MNNAEPAKPAISYISSAFQLIFEELILQVKQQTVFFTCIDKINYHRAILLLNIDFRKGMYEFLDEQTGTSIM